MREICETANYITSRIRKYISDFVSRTSLVAIKPDNRFKIFSQLAIAAPIMIHEMRSQSINEEEKSTSKNEIMNEFSSPSRSIAVSDDATHAGFFHNAVCSSRKQSGRRERKELEISFMPPSSYVCYSLFPSPNKLLHNFRVLSRIKP